MTATIVSPYISDRVETFSNLKCKECGAEYEAKAMHVCELCFGPLEVAYNYDCLFYTSDAADE